MRAALEGKAEHEGVGGDAVAHQRGRKPGRIEDVELVRRDRAVERIAHRAHLEIDVGIDDEARGRLQIGIDHGAGDAALGAAERGGRGRDHDVAAEDQVGIARRDADAGEIVGVRARCGHGS